MFLRGNGAGESCAGAVSRVNFMIYAMTKVKVVLKPSTAGGLVWLVGRIGFALPD